MSNQTNRKNTLSEKLTGKVLADRYLIQECLGKGAMGEVYRATHIMMKKTFAVKVLRTSVKDREEILVRFQREAQAAAHIDHPNVCAATDFGRDAEGFLFLVMEYLQGQTLKDALAESGRFSIHRTVTIALQITSALHRAHHMGIVHRDLKPENIFLIERGGMGDFVKILDFGIARMQLEEGDVQLTKSGVVYGTPRYLSPEQAEGEPVDHRSDLYAVGVLLYEMLAGQVPFDGKNFMQVLWKHISEPPPPFFEVAPNANIPEGLSQIVMKLLAKKKEDRFDSAEEVHDTIRDLRLHMQKPSEAISSVSGIVPSYMFDNELSINSNIKQIKDMMDESEEEGDYSPTLKVSDKIDLSQLLHVSSDKFSSSIPGNIQGIRKGSDPSNTFAGVSRTFWKFPKILGGGAILLLLIASVGIWVSQNPEPEAIAAVEQKNNTADLKSSAGTPNNGGDKPIAELIAELPSQKSTPFFDLEGLLAEEEIAESFDLLIRCHKGDDNAFAFGKLMGLQSTHQNNLAYPILLARGHSCAGKDGDALKIYRDIVEAHPSVLSSSTVLDGLMLLVGRQKKYYTKGVTEFLAEQMNDVISDRLHHVMLKHQRNQARERITLLLGEENRLSATMLYDAGMGDDQNIAKRALAVLNSTKLFETLEPWARLSLKMRHGGKCSYRQSILKEMKTVGDPRVIPAIKGSAFALKRCKLSKEMKATQKSLNSRTKP